MASTTTLAVTCNRSARRYGGARCVMEPTRRVNTTRQGDADSASADDDITTVKHSLTFILNRQSEPVSTTTPVLTNTVATKTVHYHSDERPRPRPPVAAMPATSMGLRSRQLDPNAPTMTRPKQRRHEASAQETRLPSAKIAQAPPSAATRQAAAKAKSPRARGKAPRVRSKASKSDKKGKEPLSYDQKRLARQCTVADCSNYTINKGLCFRHGGGKKCTLEGCTASAKVAGLCWKHGGSIQCVVDGCDRRGKSRGLCWTHGGGTKCQTASCEKVAVSNGFCWAHGGGKRCHFEGCQRPAYERTLNYCPKHFEKFENGEEVLEL